MEKISVNIAKTSLGEDSFLPTSNRKANLRGGEKVDIRPSDKYHISRLACQTFDIEFAQEKCRGIKMQTMHIVKRS